MTAKEHHHARPEPDLLALFDLIRYIDEHQEACPLPIHIGRWQDQANALIEALTEDGFKAYQRERAHFLNSTPGIAAHFATYTPGQEPEEQDPRFTKNDEGQKILKLWYIDDLYQLADPEYLIQLIFETIEVSMLYGESGTGKSITGLDLGLCIAHGKLWFGHPVKQGIVWYINTEGKHGFKRRVMGWHKQHGLEPTRAFRIFPWSVDLREDFPVLLDTLYTEMKKGEKPSIIIFDNFSMCADVEQNKQEQVTPILKRLNELAQDNECHVMFIHHTNKEEDFNGSMAFKNHVDTMICLKKEEKNDNHSPVLFVSKKARDREPFNTIKMEIDSITLYTDAQSLLPVTAPVMVASEQPVKQPGLHDVPQGMVDLLGDRSLVHAEWKKECMEALKIGKTSFDKYLKTLVEGGYVEKYKPDGQKVDHYRKKPRTEDTPSKGAES